MKHLGDITKIHGYEIEPVHCITFGSPCQDLSVAGKRAGLAGQRSGLFMEAVRIIKEMREATNGIYPAFAIWENVPGAFSSNKGEDFRAVLEELARIRQADATIPRPDKRWSKAGYICGDRGGWSIAWRQMDAQYWGIPQRRKRIALVMDIRGECVGEILFERTGLQGNPAQSIQPWKGVARNPENCAGRHDCVYAIQANCIDRADTAGCNGAGWNEDVSYTPNTVDRHAVAYALDSLASNSMKSKNPNSGFHETGTAKTLDCSDQNPCKNQGGIVICQRGSYQDKTGTLSPGAHAGSYNGQDAYNDMLVTQPIVFDMHPADSRVTEAKDGKLGTLSARMGTGGGNVPICIEPKCYGIDRAAFNQGVNAKYDFQIEEEKSATLVSRGPNAVCHKSLSRWIVRRLTPTECGRLQGYPDGWCDIGQWVDSKGKVHKDADSPKYKAFGNSIALPQWWWLVNKMKPYLPEGAKLGSLFDGIGGFPLVWEETYGKGTARWASEIEEFPIAVTKYHFKEEV